MLPIRYMWYLAVNNPYSVIKVLKCGLKFQKQYFWVKRHALILKAHIFSE